MAREHNGANILTLGGRTVGPEVARLLVDAFLGAAPSPQVRHQRRRKRIASAERECGS